MSIIDIRQVVYDIVERERKGETLLVLMGPLELFSLIGTVQLASRHPEFEKTLSAVRMRNMCDRLSEQFFPGDGSAIVDMGWHQTDNSDMAAGCAEARARSGNPQCFDPRCGHCFHDQKLEDTSLRAETVDWKHVAVSVARANGAFYLLTTPERDALEAALSEAPPPDPTMGIRDAESEGFKAIAVEQPDGSFTLEMVGGELARIPDGDCPDCECCPRERCDRRQCAGTNCPCTED